MPLLSNLTTIILLLIAHCASSTLANRLGPYKGCFSCKEPGRAPRDHIGQAGSTSMLAQGEPCGVYTMSCAKGLRCVPLPQEHSPLQALLQGRGICTKQSRTSPTERPHPTALNECHAVTHIQIMLLFIASSPPTVQTKPLRSLSEDMLQELYSWEIYTGPHPSHSGEIEKAPCRKLLNSVLRGVELTIFLSDRDIYIPNCDTLGFYRKKQCRSSKGVQRGLCWCVDELGTALSSRASEDGTLPCDGD